MPTLRRRWLHAAVQLGLVTALSACGFTWRGSGPVTPIPSVAVRAPAQASVAQALRVRLGQVTQVLDADAKVPSPALIIDWLDEKHERVVVGTNSAGQVRELELRTRIRWAVRDGQGETVMPVAELEQRRYLSYSEVAALAKETEEELLRKDMEVELVQQVLQRLQTLRLR